MANEQQQGLFSELGLDFNEQQAKLVALRQMQQPQQNGGPAGTFFNIGQALGQGIGKPIAAGFDALKNHKGFNQAAQDLNDKLTAQGLGITPEELQQRRQTKAALASMPPPTPTGNSFDDQMAQLDQVIQVAQKNGDVQMQVRATQKKMQVQAQKAEFAKMEEANRSAKRTNDINEQTDTTGRTVWFPGDDPQGPPSTAKYNPDTGDWTVVRPDGQVMEHVDGGKFYMNDVSSQRPRYFETAAGEMDHAFSLNGLNAGQINANRNALSDMAQTADIVGDMTQSLLNMFNPAVAFAESQKAAVASDRAFSFVETLSSLFTRSNDVGTKKTRNSYNGKAVSASKEYELGTRLGLYEDWLAENGLTIRDVLPEHIKSDTKEAQLFAANVMQLAYLNARLQEPANRGLSDNDVKAALTRIGAGTANPRVFAERQQQEMQRIQKRLDNLGAEFTPVGNVTKQQIINSVYSPELRAHAQEALDATSMKLEKFLGGKADVNQPGLNLSDEELDKAIEAEKARQEAAKANGGQ